MNATLKQLASCAGVSTLLLLLPASAQAACDLTISHKINQVQGAALKSPLLNQTVAVQGVVSALLYGKDGAVGFFMQSQAQDQDQNPATSEGIYVYAGKAALPALKAGDVVSVRGKVMEFSRKGETGSETQLQPATAGDVQLCGAGGAIRPVALMLPLSGDPAQLEALAGMVVSFAQPLYVVDSYGYGRYGELTLSSSKRLWNPTQLYRPGSAEARALQKANPLDKLILDDGKTWPNADAWLPAPGGLAANRTLRVGDQLQGVQGIVSYSNGGYRLQPYGEPAVIAGNPRPAAPTRAAGQARVASFNVLNFFNGDGLGGGFPTERGAAKREDFLRQKAKIVAAIRGLDADVVGLMELENDGFGPQSAVQELVAALNEGQSADKQYRFVDPGLAKVGTDAITTGMLYRPARAQALGKAEALAIGDTGKNRTSLAQTFQLDGRQLTLVVNHLKSKGSACDKSLVEGLADIDAGDGQGNCNLTRVAAVKDLMKWKSQRSQYPQAGLLVMGDMNAYAKEDPIRVFEESGLANLLARFQSDAYSYVYQGESGNLDHALADAVLQAWVAGAGEWHINADEPTALEYGSEFKSASQQQNYYAPDAYRSSDHDPLYVDLTMPAGQSQAESKPAGQAPASSTPAPASSSSIASADFALLGMLGLAGWIAWRRRR
ncbi:ExeM/NucH family extracellular endonuclease [Chromobacterium sp. IIBBL 290-4]|uniref:ExeM/NucH family extracellular endonuclease n=1 Tax=Chromobacterium sp. IIBBL 290-4 TaxID=2953890 RepID=UPI0020B83C0D|nr:ExeM/NucH family extracellular endonuclease [Chromobacterium sp. IIBBL 290-4]UTH72297.1 ExeM/NucH family extracellular endonuclease [Chromobacterium sp. IIBBL 290-4]